MQLPSMNTACGNRHMLAAAIPGGMSFFRVRLIEDTLLQDAAIGALAHVGCQFMGNESLMGNVMQSVMGAVIGAGSGYLVRSTRSMMPF